MSKILLCLAACGWGWGVVRVRFECESLPFYSRIGVGRCEGRDLGGMA